MTKTFTVPNNRPISYFNLMCFFFSFLNIFSIICFLFCHFQFSAHSHVLNLHAEVDGPCEQGAMNYEAYVVTTDEAENLSPPNSTMNAAMGSGSGGGSGSGSQNDPNHNVFLGGGQSGKCDPFSFLDDDDDDDHSMLGKPLRNDHAISLEDLVRNIS